MFTAAVDNGVTLIDTAEAYGFGRSEELTSWAARESTAPSSLQFATKFAPVPWRSGASSVVEACKQSRSRLGVDQIPLYQIHFPDIVKPKPIQSQHGPGPDSGPELTRSPSPNPDPP